MFLQQGYADVSAAISVEIGKKLIRKGFFLNEN